MGLVLTSVCWLVSGCAYVTRGTYQDITIETAKAGPNAEPATCEIGEADGALSTVSAASPIKVKRSRNPLKVRCSQAGQPVAFAELVPAGDLMATSFLVGGLVSGSIDYLTGAAYTYPDRITMAAGESLRFVFGDSASLRATPTAEKDPVLARGERLFTLYYRSNWQTPQLDKVRTGWRETGKDTFSAERLAEASFCTAPAVARLVMRGPGYEVHKVSCASNSDVVVRCDFGMCRVWDQRASS